MEGIPGVILTDNGTQLVSSEMEEFLSNCSIKHKKCALYHPEGNGMVEHFNRVLKGTIDLAKQNSLNWKKEVIRKVEFYRVTPHAITGRTPFELLKGRTPNTLVAPFWINDTESKRSLEGSDDDWKLNECDKIKARKVNYDLRKAVKPTKVKVGDLVMIRAPVARKTSALFQRPHRVVKV